MAKQKTPGKAPAPKAKSRRTASPLSDTAKAAAAKQDLKLEANDDVEALVEVSEIIELPASVVKSKYESNANTNAFTDAEKTKLAGLTQNTDTQLTDAEVETAYNNRVAAATQAEAETGTLAAIRRWSPLRIAQAIAALGGGGGGGVSRSVDTPAAVVNASIKAVRLGGAEVTFGGTAADGYDVGLLADTEVTQLDFVGDSTTANGAGDLVIAVDNSANGYDRRFNFGFFRADNGQEIDNQALGIIPAQVFAGNVNTITIPNIGGNFPNGVVVQMR